MGFDRFPQRIVRYLPEGSMSESGGGRPIAFVHINKTAGTSFTRYLYSHFTQPGAIAPAFYGDFGQIGIDRPSIGLYWGHFPFAQFVLHRPDAWFITFLRDPVQRVVSQYRSFHNPANAGDGWEQVIPPRARRALEFAREATFEEFVFSEDSFILDHLRDLQTRFLTSHLDYDHPEFLSSAIRNLEHRFLFFGTTESFQDAIRLFSYQLGSDEEYHAEQHQRNVSPMYSAEIQGRVRDRVEQLVQHDLKLYEHASAVFRHRLQVLDHSDNEIPRTRAA